ncbi:MAG: delta-60 repeat domain-containing protein [Casimicrobium sp.]
MFRRALSSSARQLTATLLAILVFMPSESAYATAGQLDPSFGVDGGKVTTAIGRSRAFATATAIQHDGKIVVAGQCEFGANHFCLVRYNPDGSLDNEFGIAGKVVTVEMASDHLGGIALQPDGKIVVAGTCFSYSTFSYFFCTARYHAYGALDASFGGAGVVSGRIAAGDDVAAAVTLQSDGKIIVAGSCRNISNSGLCVARYGVDGVADATFNGGEVLVTSLGYLTGYGAGVAVLPNGKILLSGHCTDGTNLVLCMTRLNPSGDADITFGKSGRVSTSPSTEANVESAGIVVLSDGRLVQFGTCHDGMQDYFCLSRHDPNGSSDLAFNLNGMQRSIGNAGELVRAAVAQPDGKVLLAGQCPGQVGSLIEYCIARFDVDGSIDPTFGIAGWTFVRFGGSLNVATGVALQRDGKAVVTGYCDVPDRVEFCVARLLEDDAHSVPTGGLAFWFVLTSLLVVGSVRRFANSTASSGE